MKKLYNYPAMLIICVLACISVVVGEVCILAKAMVLNPDYYLWVIDKKNVTDVLYNELDEAYEQLSVPTYIPKEVYMNSITREQLSATTRSVARSSMQYILGWTNDKPVIDYDFTQMENDITDYIETYSEANSIEKDDVYYETVENTIEVAREKLEPRLDVLLLKKISESRFTNQVRKYSPLVSAILSIAAVVTAVLLIFMVIINRRHIIDIIYWVGTILFVSGGLLLIPSLYLSLTNYFDGFILSDPTIYAAMTGALYGIVDRMVMVNIIMCCAGVVFIIFAQIAHSIRKSEIKRRREEMESIES
ncbi:MAG: hypothetical protein IJ806_03445 [Ruminococcus sp.]|nr:hypothetical protein [Ruminococcus sp.]